MHRYFIKTPWMVRKLFPAYLWRVNTSRKEVFLTFDDGPHPEITAWVLETLAQYNARATFFCVGNNVHKHPKIYTRLLQQNHTTGNHTYHHLNGWKVPVQDYVQDVALAAKLIQSPWFRPPYGKIKPMQKTPILKALNQANAQVVMWDVLSADFDASITGQQCLKNVLNNCGAGSIVVFHDSEKAFPRLKTVLPQVLKQLSDKGFSFKGL